MLDSLRLYKRYLGVSVRSQMQYRASFLMLSLGHFLETGIEFLGMAVFFDRFGHLAGWTLPEVGLFYGLVNVAFALAEAAARGFDSFEHRLCQLLPGRGHPGPQRSPGRASLGRLGFAAGGAGVPAAGAAGVQGGSAALHINRELSL